MCLCGNSQAASTIYIEVQRTKNRKIFLKKKEQGKKTYFTIYQDTLQNYVTKAVWHCLKDEQIQQTKIMCPETDTSIFGNLICSKGGTTEQWEEDQSFQ